MDNNGNSRQKQFTRSRRNRVLGGLCSSISERMDLDVSIVRILVVILSFVTSGTVALIYLIAWIIVPEEPRGGQFYTQPPPPPQPPFQAESAPPPPPQSQYHSGGPQGQPNDPFMAEEVYQNRRRRSMLIVGVCLAAAGCLMLVQILFGSILQWRYIWPLIIICVGAAIIIYSGRRN